MWGHRFVCPKQANKQTNQQTNKQTNKQTSPVVSFKETMGRSRPECLPAVDLRQPKFGTPFSAPMDSRIFGLLPPDGGLAKGVFDIKLTGHAGIYMGSRVPDGRLVTIHASGLGEGRYTLYSFRIGHDGQYLFDTCDSWFRQAPSPSLNFLHGH